MIISVIGSDATMVNDAVHNAIAEVLGDLDATMALEDFTVTETAVDDERPILTAILAALNTPPFLLPRRVIAVRNAQWLPSSDVAAIAAWAQTPTAGIDLIVGRVGAKRAATRSSKAKNDGEGARSLEEVADRVIDTTVAARAPARLAYVTSTFAQHKVTADARLLNQLSEHFGDDMASVDALARLLASIYGTAPLTWDHVAAHVGVAGGVPEWDLTNALEAGDASQAIAVARRMLASRSKVGIQIVGMLHRYYARLAQLDGAGELTMAQAAALIDVTFNPQAKFHQVSKFINMAQRLGSDRIADAVHLIASADGDLKGGVTYGGRSLDTDEDPTELIVIEVLVARLARLTPGRR